jgi:hypothetical protein
VGLVEVRRGLLAQVDGAAFGADGQHIAFHVDVDRVGVHPREVERDHELVAVADRVGGHRRRP